MVDRVRALWRGANEAQRWLWVWGLVVMLPPSRGGRWAQTQKAMSPGGVRVAACLFAGILGGCWVWDFFLRKHRPASVRGQIGWWTNATCLYCVLLLATMYLTGWWPVWWTQLPVYFGFGRAMYIETGALSPPKAQQRAWMMRDMFAMGVILFVVRHFVAH